MGVRFPAPVQLARSLTWRGRAVPCEVAAWGEGEACGGLDKLKRGERGGRARLTLARPLWGGGLCCVGRRVMGERKGAAASDSLST
jgi:hypothetical protein